MKNNRGRPRLDNVRVTCMFDPEVHKQIVARAERESRPFSNMLNVIVREHFEKKDMSDAGS